MQARSAVCFALAQAQKISSRLQPSPVSNAEGANPNGRHPWCVLEPSAELLLREQNVFFISGGRLNLAPMLKVRSFVIFSFVAGAAALGRAWLMWEGDQALLRLRFWEILFESHLNKLILLNMGCNMLYVLAKCMQLLFLGQLRELEAHKVGDRVRSYALVKIVFIGAILQDHDDKEMIVWFVWLSLVGFLKQMGLLVRDRLEYLTLSINTRAFEYLKLADLLALVQAGNIGLVYLCVKVFGCWHHCQPGGLGVLFLLLFECALILLDGLQTAVRYCLHVINQRRDGQWEQRALYTFYSELICDLLHHSLSLLHFLHVWLVHGLSFTLTDALLFLHTRAVLNNIRLKLSSLRTFLTMDRRFPDATPEQLSSVDDNCSICRESMSSAKVLPCGHVFHLVCLRAWLEHSNSCPNCRRPIDGDGSDGSGNASNNRQERDGDLAFEDGGRREMQSWDIFSWLPSLSVRVARQRLPAAHPVGPGEGGVGAGHPRGSMASAVPQALVRQVLEVLPHLSPAAIRRDLALTLDVHVTIHRGLDGLIDSAGDVSETIPEEDEERLIREGSMDSGNSQRTQSDPSHTEEEGAGWDDWGRSDEDRWGAFTTSLSGRDEPFGAELSGNAENSSAGEAPAGAEQPGAGAGAEAGKEDGGEAGVDTDEVDAGAGTEGVGASETAGREEASAEVEPAEGVSARAEGGGAAAQPDSGQPGGEPGGGEDGAAGGWERRAGAERGHVPESSSQHVAGLPEKSEEQRLQEVDPEEGLRQRRALLAEAAVARMAREREAESDAADA